MGNELAITYPRKFYPLARQRARRKIAKGGRGSAKSESFGRLAVRRAATEKLRFLCCRELQSSIKESVHQTLKDAIFELQLDRFFRITDTSIKSWTGSEFLFRGMRNNYNEIKSLKGIDVAWLEEGEGVSQNSLDILVPTIRKPGSEIWVSYNPETKESPCDKTFITQAHPESIIVDMNWRDNPWFPDVLRREMEWCKEVDFEKYMWVWEGQYKAYAEDVIFKDKIEVDCEFEAEPGTQFHFGLDFGFSNDPLSFHRYFIKDYSLYIEYEAYGRGIELDDIHKTLLTVPLSKYWPIRADSSRPDTISFLCRPFEKDGVKYPSFNVIAAEKGEGSVEDGISFLRSFKKIYIHKRCPGAKEDYQNYRWKRDRITNAILAVPLDKSNHAPDDTRYALEPYIKKKLGCFEVLNQLESEQ